MSSITIYTVSGDDFDAFDGNTPDVLLSIGEACCVPAIGSLWMNADTQTTHRVIGLKHLFAPHKPLSIVLGLSKPVWSAEDSKEASK